MTLRKANKVRKNKLLIARIKLLITWSFTHRLHIGIVGYLLLACGIGILYGWKWSEIVVGMAVPLIFALGLKK